MPEEEKPAAAAQRDGPLDRRASHHHRQFEVMGAHPTERGLSAHAANRTSVRLGGRLLRCRAGVSRALVLAPFVD